MKVAPHIMYSIMKPENQWATTRQNVFSGVFDEARHKPAWAATEAS